MNDPTADTRRPGDITVTPLRHGYLLGRVLPQRGPGPWWEYVGIETDVESAMALARHLARLEEVRAWFYDGHDHYSPLPTEDSDAISGHESNPEIDALYQKVIVRTTKVRTPPSVKASQRSRRR
jgi:hypothetical protein